MRKQKHVPIDISQYTQSTSLIKRHDGRIFDKRPSLPVIGPEQHDIEDHCTSPRFKRHVPIVIPAFAQPFSEAADARPSLQEAVQGWRPSPHLRRKKRLPSLTVTDLPLVFPTSVDFDAEHSKLINEIIARMNSSQTSLSEQDSNREESIPPTQSTFPSSSQIAVLPGSNQHLGGSGPTNLSGLVCNVHRTTGREPPPLVGATTTILGDKLYVFGGRVLSRTRPELTSNLYELDIVRRNWTKVEPVGDIPPPRYFHSVCALGDTKLVCYGGMSPVASTNGHSASGGQGSEAQSEVVVMSDIHIFDVPTRTWILIPTPETPQGRYAHCATILPSSTVFTSVNAPLSAIHHNPSSSNPHSGTLGVKLDGKGGAEMVVVGGQDSSNHYIEQISVFNLRSLKWTATNSLGRSCGAYRSVVAPLIGMPVSSLGKGTDLGSSKTPSSEINEVGHPMLIYSNYNFLDVKLELQVLQPDGRLSEEKMSGTVSPPGLRFPNGGVIANHFVVSGTYLTSSKQEYALWALDLRTLTWSRIDAGGTVFAQGSWNRGVLWGRRNTYVILGHRKRSLVEDYNHRRLNFTHICMVELEAFGLYDNPRKSTPTSGYVSISSPPIPASLQSRLALHNCGGRPFSPAAERLGQVALSIKELADMDLVAINGERIPVNSHILSRRWGPYFHQLLIDSATSHDTASDATTLRPNMVSHTSRNSSTTITPSIGNVSTHSANTMLNVNNGTTPATDNSTTNSRTSIAYAFGSPESAALLPSSRPRTLYMPHTPQTIRLMLQYLYTSSLPPTTSPLCTPQILCSLLQLARPYQIDGLLEATVERLHEVLDGRNAAAVFNASAMAAGGGRGLAQVSGGALETLVKQNGKIDGAGNEVGRTDWAKRAGSMTTKSAGLRINTSFDSLASSSRRQRGHDKAHSVDSASTATSASTSTSSSHTDSGTVWSEEHGGIRDPENKEVWTGDVSSVIGLQKRGLRGLMEGRRLRERGNTGASSGGTGAGPVGKPVGMGLGII